MEPKDIFPSAEGRTMGGLSHAEGDIIRDLRAEAGQCTIFEPPWILPSAPTLLEFFYYNRTFTAENKALLVWQNPGGSLSV